MPFAGLSLDGMVALVTGSARGIGSALAVGLAEAGADIAVSDLPERSTEMAVVRGHIQALGRQAQGYSLNVLDVKDIESVIQQVAQDFGRIDILVNNAGIRRRAPALEVTEADWDAVIDTNLKGAFFCAQAAARQMIDQGGGRIINVASQLSLVGAKDRAAYCASKGGLTNLTRVLALEWIKYGITVNAIGPGPTETPGLVEADSCPSEELAMDLAAHMPLGRRMQPEELVGAAIYLASPSAGATTGHLLIVDGGWTVQ
jgi:NAD(P)-dependent dehydrogenase (short-subunit alcohol dehydrogenase family)